MKFKLRVYIDKCGDTLEELAKALDITYQTLSKKMNGHVEFTREELGIIKDRYSLTAEQFCEVFFED